MMKPVPIELIECIKNNHNFLIMTHKKPDGDAIGSTVALGKALKQIGKNVTYYIDVPFEDKLTDFNEVKTFNETLLNDYDVLIIVDTSTFDHIFKPQGTIQCKLSVVIDHHVSNEAYGDINFIEVTSATGELVYHIITALGIDIDLEIAAAIFTSISTDTGSFQFSNVTADTHQIVSKLYEIDNNYAVLSKKLHREKTYNQMKMYGCAIDSLEIFKEVPIAWTILDMETINKYGGNINITEDISNIGSNIESAKMSVTLKQSKVDEYRVSLRSKSPFNMDVSIFAKSHGGGGHMRAAGFTFKGNPDVLKRELIAFFESEWNLKNVNV